jgi:hypothetical protein
MDLILFCPWNFQEIQYCQSIWQTVDLDYKYCSAIVTDAEAIILKPGCLFARASFQAG